MEDGNLTALNFIDVRRLRLWLAMSDGKPSRSIDDEEREIIRRVVEGRVDLFETLIQRHQPRVFATARKYARRESEVEDIVQEIFIKAFQNLGRYRGEAPFLHWLMRIAVRTCYDFLRRHQRNRESNFSEITEEDADFLDRYVSDSLPDDLRADAVRKLVHDVLERLPAPLRMVITLQAIEGKSVQEIADLTGWSIVNVKVRAHRARKEMRKLFDKIDKSQYL